MLLSPCRDTYNTYKSGSGKASQPRWILVIGAAGIVFGLAMYGYRIIAVSSRLVPLEHQEAKRIVFCSCLQPCFCMHPCSCMLTPLLCAHPQTRRTSTSQTLGVDLVVMTPSRGYSVELAAAAIIALASTYGLPVSTTQVVVSGISQ